MRKLFAPAILIPIALALCTVFTFGLPLGSDFRVLAAIGLFVIMAFFLNVFVHELGHATGALLARLRIVTFAAGPLLVERRPKGNYVLRPNMHPALLLAGLVRISPTSYDNIRFQRLLCVLGGPLASGLLCVLFLLCASRSSASSSTLLPNGVSFFHFEVWTQESFLVIAGLISLLFFVGNILPLYDFTTRLPTDGLQLIQLLRGGLIVERDTALMMLSGLLFAHRRPRDLPSQLLETALIINDNTHNQVFAHYLAYLKALDIHDLRQAEQHVVRMKALYRKASPLFRPELAFAIALHEAMEHANITEARMWLKEANNKSRTPSFLGFRANAAVLFLEGKTEEATQQITTGMTILTKEFENQRSDMIDFEQEQTDRVARRYMAVIRRSVPR